MRSILSLYDSKDEQKDLDLAKAEAILESTVNTSAPFHDITLAGRSLAEILDRQDETVRQKVAEM